MRHALIIAGGSGTRLWPMSRKQLPKQLIPFIGGKSLLGIAFERLEGLVPVERRWICAGLGHKDLIHQAVPGLRADRFLGEPTGRDTLNAVGYAAAIIAREDPEATIAVFTADHIIEPVDQFQATIDAGYALAESRPNTLVTFGVKPTEAATGYGYLELGEAIAPAGRRVMQFREKPQAEAAKGYFAAGPEKYLWNSGMFVWKASTLLDCIGRYEPEVARSLGKIADAWNSSREEALSSIYPTLKKISVDYAVMEPASRDAKMTVAAIPMQLRWLDVGSWPSYALTCPADDSQNRIAARSVLMDCKRTLIASSDPNQVITAIGCDDLVIVHTPGATLVCRADMAEKIKELHGLVGKNVSPDLQ